MLSRPLIGNARANFAAKNIEMANIEIRGKQPSQRRPIEMRRPSALRVITANFSARGLDRQCPKGVAAAGEGFGQTEMKGRALGVEFDLSGGTFFACDADALDRNGSQKRRGDFAELDF